MRAAFKNSRASLKPSGIHCLSLVALSYSYSEKEKEEDVTD